LRHPSVRFGAARDVPLAHDQPSARVLPLNGFVRHRVAGTERPRFTGADLRRLPAAVLTAYAFGAVHAYHSRPDFALGGLGPPAFLQPSVNAGLDENPD